MILDVKIKDVFTKLEIVSGVTTEITIPGVAIITIENGIITQVTDDSSYQALP